MDPQRIRNIDSSAPKIRNDQGRYSSRFPKAGDLKCTRSEKFRRFRLQYKRCRIRLNRCNARIADTRARFPHCRTVEAFFATYDEFYDLRT